MTNQNPSEMQDPRKELIAKIITRAWKDPEFKKQLLTKPKVALREMHFPFPENVKLRIVEEGEEERYANDDKNILTILLPKQPIDSHKLSDQELSSLAGAGAQTVIFQL
jgi:hypothetical protein